MADSNSAFTTLLKRLEAATSRLEDLAMTGNVASQVKSGAGSGAAGAGAGGASAPFVEAYDAILSGPLAEFLKASRDIDGLVKDQVRVFFFSSVTATFEWFVLIATLSISQSSPLINNSIPSVI
jgi:adenylyl cyclase-associated protein